MSEVIEEGNNIGDLLRYEQDKNFCREVVAVAANSAIKIGTILGKKTADGTYAAVDTAAEDGTQTAVAVALTDAETKGGKTTVVALVRNGIVVKGGLIYPNGADDAAKAAIDKALEAASILVREDF